MRLKVLFLLVGMVSGLTPSPPAQAVFGGTQASGSALVLTLLTSKTARTSFCSMALLTERIVVTAAHCVIEDQGIAPNLRWKITDMYVSQPGADVTKDDISSRVQVNKVVTRDDFINTWKPEIGDYRTQINDIAFLFLEKPLVAGYTVKIATDEEINLAIAKGELVTHLGYGLQAPNAQSHSPWKTQLRLVDGYDPHLDKSKVVYSQEGPTALCPGDSGGPWYIDVGGEVKIAAVLVAASGCRGSMPYNGVALGARIAPYMEMANSKWNEFISSEHSAKLSQQLSILELEKIRKQAITDGTYIAPGGCHVPGINAELQSLNSSGTWNVSTPATGWLPSEASCQKTHTTQPWTVSKVADGTKLRWRYWGDSWQVYGEIFIWRNLLAVENETASIERPTVKAAKVTIICTKGKSSKKISAVKPKCPTGWKVKR